MKFRFDVYHHFGDDNISVLESLLKDLLLQGKMIMATQAEVVEKINASNEKLGKIIVEEKKLIDLVQELKDALAAQPQATPELEQAVDNMANQIGVLDDQVPDAVDPPIEV